jgi:segregation and condensation protein B
MFEGAAERIRCSRPLVEAFLFVSGEPVAPAELAASLGVEAAVVEEFLEDLVNIYARRPESGLQIVRIAGGYQMATRPAYGTDLARLLASPDRARFSRAALETLAIIAYRQPVTQMEIEAVRGVAVDSVLKTLIDRRMIAEAGRKAAPGRPILYGTTPEFLHYFGMAALDDLPPLEDVPVEELKEHSEATHKALESVGLE